ncbi:MAG: tripartite tricarboxylate transporter substrate binding protein [Alphaproteobacteria bacterium]|nr:tripartite tricarboxylate transporter substrate binding protein [Alphaproteobacteria bacterium]
MRGLLAGVLALMGLVMAVPASAAYPDHPIHLIVPWAPGGSTDILARTAADKLRETLGQPVLVENRPGASGNVGSAIVAKAAPDGYTILFGSMSTHAMNPALMPSMPFDGVADFTPLAMLAFVTNTMVIHPSVPANSVAELVAYAKQNPGKLVYASAGVGSTNHLCGVLFEKLAGIQMLHVPYSGGAPAVRDTVAGATQLFFSAGTQTLPHVKAGELKLLAVTEDHRSALLPDVPTVAETLPGYEMSVWYGAFGPRGMVPELVTQLNGAINTVMTLPDVKARMAEIGVEVVSISAAQFGERLHADAKKWGDLIREFGIKAE